MWGGCTGGEKERKWRKWGEEEEEEEKWRCVTDYIWKKLWFPGFKQCGKGFEEIYCFTHEHTNFVLLKLCKNCTGIWLNPSSLLPLPQFHLCLVLQIIFLPQHRQYSSYLSSSFFSFPLLSRPLFPLRHFIVFIISFPLPPFISFCPLPLPPLSPLFFSLLLYLSHLLLIFTPHTCLLSNLSPLIS